MYTMIKVKYTIYAIYILVYTIFRISYVPANSAPVERVFSRAGRIISPLWSRLSPRYLKLNTLIACNTND